MRVRKYTFDAHQAVSANVSWSAFKPLFCICIQGILYAKSVFISVHSGLFTVSGVASKVSGIMQQVKIIFFLGNRQ
jgi:hypothetical protein